MIPYGRQSVTEADAQAVVEALQSDFLTTGPRVQEFEKKLCEITGAKHAVACANGTAALHLACLALDIKPGDVGLTSAITFVASANCVEYCGGRADFLDIDPNRLCLLPGSLEHYIRQNGAPKVVIPVDYAGIPADLPAIWVLAQKYGFKVIEDAAHAVGSTYVHQGRKYNCGSCAHSDLAVFSFHPVKTLTTGEGGAVLTNDDALAKRLRLFCSHGITREPGEMDQNDGPWFYQQFQLGFNYRLTDFQCALGLSQAARLTEFKARRQAIVRRYNEAFKANAALIPPPWPEGSSPCYHLYPLQFAGGPGVRQKVYDALKAAGISAQVHYIPVPWQPYYRRKYEYRPGHCPSSERFYNRVLSLPLYPVLGDGEVDRVIETVAKNAD